MTDWVEGLAPGERDEWNNIVRHARTKTFDAMGKSAFIMSLIPAGTPDIKFCVELGMAIMLNKPIIAVAVKGVTIPPRLREIADEVVEIAGDIDTEEGRAEMRAEMSAAMGRLMDCLP